MTEGYVKFELEWKQTISLADYLIEDLESVRKTLYDQELIGVYPDGIGFGNVSIRNGRNFIISGTQTGDLPELTGAHYSKVTAVSLKHNRCRCEGAMRASSESMTHAAIYKYADNAHSVLHVHDKSHWKRLMNKIPTTKPGVAYGTPEMAKEVKRLFDKEKLDTVRCFAMAGHEEGIIAFGTDPEDALQVLRKQGIL